ncbi:helix-turn-helix domain-containing protein [Yinghuangia soli]|uniref:Helix-turn-helix domain-containing protein n=1 Tax=Yinghuangia soli TaxID=2908204 RepID=A0AA41Q9Q2_9ACTN|nr:helix-turn-helix domain-containing protein [Yinghuangia soli]MCF2533346.1 helix-turn-helix domain-containing protein [Yinghuangia soli]
MAHLREAEASLTRRPSVPALRPLIHAIGYTDAQYAHAAELALPNGGVQLLVNLDGDVLSSTRLRDGSDAGPDGPSGHAHSGPGTRPPAVTSVGGGALQGPYTGPAVIDPAQQRAIVWVAFRTAGAHPFLGDPLAAVRDRLVGLDDLWGRSGATLRERLLHAMEDGGPAACLAALEAALLDAAEPDRLPDPAVLACAARLDAGATVAEAADSVGWTTRRLSERFGAHVGLAPKQYARVRRFQRLLAQVNAGPQSPDWALLAADCGYHDQAHLIHEFRALAGMTPTAYAPRSAAEPNHVPLGG